MLTRNCSSWILMSCTLALGSAARDSHVGEGSAIVPVMSLKHDVIRPGEHVNVMACLTNGNPHSGRSIETGDAFTLSLGYLSPEAYAQALETA